MSKFSERLRQLRDESGKTQSQIAKDLGLTPQAFSYFVNGREPSFDNLCRIADYFGVTGDYLIGHDVDNGGAEAKRLAEMQKQETLDKIQSEIYEVLRKARTKE